MSKTNKGQKTGSWKSDGMQDVFTAGAILLFALGGFIFINSNNVTVYPGDGGLTWRTLPFGYAGLLALLSTVYLVQALRKVRSERAQAAPPPPPSATEAAEDRVVLFRRLASIGLLVIFVSLLKTLGFAMLAPLFLFVLFRLYQRGPWTGDLLISVIGGLLLWLLFVPILKMNLVGTGFDPLSPVLMQFTRAMGL